MYIITKRLVVLKYTWKKGRRFSMIQNIFTKWLYLPCFRVWTPEPGTMNFTILVKGFMDIKTIYFLFFAKMYWSWEDFIRFYTFFGYIGPALGGLNHWPKGHDFHNFDRRLHEHYDYAFSFFLTCVGSREEIFWIFNLFCIFGPLMNPQKW